MDIAALIISILALVVAISNLVWNLSKHFSTHTIQREFVDPFKDSVPSQAGKDFLDAFREIDHPVDSEELEQIELLRKRKLK